MASVFAKQILENRHNRNAILPSKQESYRFIDNLIELLYPHYSGEYEYFAPEEIDGQLSLLMRDLKKIMQPIKNQLKKPIDQIGSEFFNALPEIYNQLWMDARAIYKGDPAAQSMDEVISAYP
ncbi:MAG: serine acetyltransferase, partial [Caldithrix sp.]|nr:serine acetyltransferase [Caldithrix sp.]